MYKPKLCAPNESLERARVGGIAGSGFLLGQFGGAQGREHQPGGGGGGATLRVTVTLRMSLTKLTGGFSPSDAAGIQDQAAPASHGGERRKCGRLYSDRLRGEVLYLLNSEMVCNHFRGGLGGNKRTSG